MSSTRARIQIKRDWIRIVSLLAVIIIGFYLEARVLKSSDANGKALRATKDTLEKTLARVAQLEDLLKANGIAIPPPVTNQPTTPTSLPGQFSTTTSTSTSTTRPRSSATTTTSSTTVAPRPGGTTTTTAPQRPPTTGICAAGVCVTTPPLLP